MTGSNSKTLSKDIDSNFADRGTQIRVWPFSFAEYCDAVKPEDKSEALSKYLIWGGMPLAVLEADDRRRARYLQNLFSEALEKGIYGKKRKRASTPGRSAQ